MTTSVLERAVRGAAFALATLPPSAFAQAPADVVELRTRCVPQRTAALVEVFGPDHSVEQGLVMDARIGESLARADTPQSLAEAYQAFVPNPDGRHPAADRYAQCLHGERLKQLDPQVDLQQVLRGEYRPPAASAASNAAWGAALSRRDANTAAGAAALARSADPVARAARERENAQLRQESAERVAQRRREYGGFWDEMLQVAAVSGQIYLQNETIRAQAKLDAAVAQAQADAYAQPQPFAQVQAPYPAPQVAPPPTAPPRTAPSSSAPSAYPPSSGGAQSFINPQTGRQCVEPPVATHEPTYSGGMRYSLTFTNTCDRVFVVTAYAILVPGADPNREKSEMGIQARGKLTLSCTNDESHSACAGFRLYEIR